MRKCAAAGVTRDGGHRSRHRGRRRRRHGRGARRGHRLSARHRNHRAPRRAATSTSSATGSIPADAALAAFLVRQRDDRRRRVDRDGGKAHVARRADRYRRVARTGTPPRRSAPSGVRPWRPRSSRPDTRATSPTRSIAFSDRAGRRSSSDRDRRRATSSRWFAAPAACRRSPIQSRSATTTVVRRVHRGRPRRHRGVSPGSRRRGDRALSRDGR